MSPSDPRNPRTPDAGMPHPEAPEPTDLNERLLRIERMLRDTGVPVMEAPVES